MVKSTKNGYIAAMSSKQRLATMVRAGIYTKSGKLTKQYGG
jgi:hypothetical protein